MSNSQQTASTAHDGANTANIIPTIARSLLGLVEDRGHSPGRLCQGLGIRYEDLLSHQLLLSHRQVRALILRARQLLNEPALGLIAGARETPVSWGVAGLAMLTCETLGEAMDYVLARQNEAGTMVQIRVTEHGDEVRLHLVSHRFDWEIENYLIDETLAGAVAVARYLLGPSFRPLHISLTQPQPPHHAQYRRYYGCPVHFGSGHNMMAFETHWLGTRLPGYDRIASQLLRRQLDGLLQAPPGRHQLIETVSNHIRYASVQGADQQAVASMINVSSRSLRRQLERQGTSYCHLRDSTRYQAACELLDNTVLSMTVIAEQLGYADARSFRRAFKRWSSILPGDYRRRLREN
ncbi:AraC family transcriptional regulator [Aeromonas caviae]|uniref:AraC family transcriptional regulator n=1 Tax=Aeromonas caviae TaxID=648 RepID=UPI00137910FA|nr:AraC family transcriptional regulator [Aeromonas caviae]MBL0605317.1 AraC family transcriptional regulator [Aeromonas caviae]MDX7596289.1 AraC family transcriptional regulator [Aeromonas caviae]MDX7803296.1 AraC family transcriptional regulator [Aeromonas caviae]MDY7796694.1 AraC family transcriptional regulator [Aeromonas caviae]MDY7890814.1 AraC family transcriptional regulator [Aeromonas caviae]